MEPYQACSFKSLIIWETYEAYKLLETAWLSKGVEKEDAKDFKDKPLKEFVNEVWLSVLDGAMNPKDKKTVLITGLFCLLRQCRLK